MDINKLFGQLNDHEHTGKDSKKVKFQNLGNLFIVTAAPTFAAPEYSMALRIDAGNTKIYFMINGAWKSAALT